MFVAVGGRVLVLELSSGRIVDTIRTAPGSAFWTAVHPSGRYLAVGCGWWNERLIAVIRITDHEVVSRHVIGASHGPPRVVWSPDGRWLAAVVDNVKNLDEQVHVFPVGRSAMVAPPAQNRWAALSSLPEADSTLE